MLSLSPRYDLFRFSFPKDFLPEEIEAKYTSLIRQNQAVITTPIDYLNESIQGINFPGISDIIIQQQQHSSNDITRTSKKLNVEPKREQIYHTPSNPLDKIELSFKVTFRMNQGLYNYFMLYETAFYYACREFRWQPEHVMFIEILNEEGLVVSKVKFLDVFINGIEGQEFSYNKIERDADTFDVILVVIHGYSR